MTAAVEGGSLFTWLFSTVHFKMYQIAFSPLSVFFIVCFLVKSSDEAGGEV